MTVTTDVPAPVAQGRPGVPAPRPGADAPLASPAAAAGGPGALVPAPRPQDHRPRARPVETALLTLAHDLRSATEPTALAEVVVRGVRAVVGCDASTLFLWDEPAGRLQPAASSGLSAAGVACLAATTIAPDNAPELVALLTGHEPTVLDVATASDTVGALMAGLGLSAVMAMPLLAGGELVGVVTAAWVDRPAALAVAAARTRLSGVADFTAAALENVLLAGTVRHQSTHDALTGLPNRVLFTRRLDHALQQQDARGRVAVLFCDLDRFRQVNHALGHAGGDELLRQAARRLEAAVRPGDLVARLGDDEFAVLLERVESAEAAEATARAVVAALAVPFRVDGLDLRVTLSVGVAVHDGQQAAGDALLRAADGARSAAKRRGRNQVARAGRGGARPPHLPHRRISEWALRAAVGRGELRLHYQRLVDITAPPTGALPGRTVGVEALLRWQHPQLGLLAPDVFLPLAEETDLVVELDLWAVRAACRALAHWPAGDGTPRHVAVNTAARTLVDPRLQPTVIEALRESGLGPAQLCLEVVESRSLVDLPRVADRLAALRQVGVRVSLDDFGTGYSTLSWLQRLPVDQVKLDRSFTAAISDDATSLPLARGVLALAAELGVEVAVEGVETLEQLAVLRAAGFTLAQGYLWGSSAPAPGAAAPVGPTPA